MTTIADDNGALQSFNDRVAPNNLGRVAFIAFDDAYTREARFTGNGGALTEVATVAAPLAAAAVGAAPGQRG